jgi:hypothetical protein
MNDNLQWTQALGAAFAVQPADVMKSIQQLRARAKAAGTLSDTPQQTVDIEGDALRIVPTQSETIYVPEYDAGVVYDVPQGYVGPFMTFGVGYPVGPWLGFECDWDDFGIWIGPWQQGWGYRRDWLHPEYGGSRWRFDSGRSPDLVRSFYRPGEGVSREAGRGRVAMPHSPGPDYRGYGSAETRTPRSASPGQLFGGYNRGAQVRDYSVRGQSSRQAPVRGSAPARSGSRPPNGRNSH